MNWNSFNRLVLVNETLFGLPWVITTISLAFVNAYHDVGLNVSAWILFWMLLAFVSCRVTGMALNRLIDCEIDARNPRTCTRPLASGELSRFQVMMVALISVGLFIWACGSLGLLCLCLAPLALLLMGIYSFTKRVTSLCHLFLGSVHFLIPVFVWAALYQEIALAPVLLGTALLLSIGAADVIYAIQDVEFDESEGLYSLPLLLGTQRAIRMAKELHGCALLFLIFTGLSVEANVVYFSGVLAVAGIYAFCYANLRLEVPESLHHFLSACNRRVALTLMLFSIGAVLWPHLL